LNTVASDLAECDLYLVRWDKGGSETGDYCKGKGKGKGKVVPVLFFKLSTTP
jgi:hypothetical protein